MLKPKISQEGASKFFTKNNRMATSYAFNMMNVNGCVIKKNITKANFKLRIYQKKFPRNKNDTNNQYPSVSFYEVRNFVLSNHFLIRILIERVFRSSSL